MIGGLKRCWIFERLLADAFRFSRAKGCVGFFCGDRYDNNDAMIRLEDFTILYNILLKCGWIRELRKKSLAKVSLLLVVRNSLFLILLYYYLLFLYFFLSDNEVIR